jgi:hypothetical protein
MTRNCDTADGSAARAALLRIATFKRKQLAATSGREALRAGEGVRVKFGDWKL